MSNILRLENLCRRLWIGLRADATASHIVTFLFVIPLIIAGILSIKRVTNNQIEYLLTFFSIITGFLFNALMMIVTQPNGEKEKKASDRYKKVQLLKDNTYPAVIYSILIGILFCGVLILVPLNVLNYDFIWKNNHFPVLRVLFWFTALHTGFIVLRILKVIWAVHHPAHSNP